MNRYLVYRGADAKPDDLLPNGLATNQLKELASVYSSYVLKTYESADEVLLDEIARDICESRRLSIWGVNRTFESVCQLSNRLFRIGIFNHCTSDFMVMDDVGAIFGEGDACIVFSVNGRGYNSYGMLMDSMRDRGCSVTLFTMNPRLELAKHATRAVVLPWVSNDYTITALDDQLVFMAYVELLLNKVAHRLQE